MCETPGRSRRLHPEYLPAILLLCLYVAIVINTAWLSDDAYITFRTVDNFVHGYGLTWNTEERVQSYTHPLWMLLLVPPYLLGNALFGLAGEIYYPAILLSILAAAGGAVVYTFGVAGTAYAAMAGLLTFTLSRAYIDYSTSGLENPLTHLLLLAFLAVYLHRSSPDRPRALLSLSLLGSLLALSRLDALLLIAPALLVAAFTTLRAAARPAAAFGRAVRDLLLGFLPLIAWTIFSTIYYGTPLPNTAYAKLNHGLPADVLWQQGLRYLLRSFAEDTLTPVVILAGLVVPLAFRQWRSAAVSLGALLYVLYTVKVGGDFMIGRFLTGPLVCGVGVLTGWAAVKLRLSLLMIFVVAVLGLRSSGSPLFSGASYSAHFIPNDGIVDERGYYYEQTGLLRAMHRVRLPSHPGVAEGEALRARGPGIYVHRNIGFLGYYAGPAVHLIDELALADAFLARLQPDLSRSRRIGHLYRNLPAGYAETIATEVNHIADPALATFYDRVALVTRGKLFDPARWRAMVVLNFGPWPQGVVPPEPKTGTEPAGP